LLSSSNSFVSEKHVTHRFVLQEDLVYSANEKGTCESGIDWFICWRSHADFWNQTG